jgi:Sulphur transport
MVAILSLAFLLAFACAALMGFAIQRGATCTVAAMGEIVEKGRANRLLALGETSVWVSGGLVFASLLGLTGELPNGFAANGYTILGGVLLGLGAWANRACVFGSIARLGSGEWAYLMTPLGFFAGVWAMRSLSSEPIHVPISGDAPSDEAWLLALFVTFIAWRVWRFIRSEAADRDIWHPHHATIVIGITFTILFLAVGAWAYTDLLSELAHGRYDDALWQLVLFAALLLGAIGGGRRGGFSMRQRPAKRDILRCLGGGLAMGWGSALIPGGNDGLILVGMPFFWLYAWLGIATMCITIGIALVIENRLSPQSSVLAEDLI